MTSETAFFMAMALASAPVPTADSITDWTAAISTAITAVVAVIALVYAGKQLKEASAARKQTKALELEKSQPYVVVTMEEVDGNPTIINLVIRNYGSTIARDVRVKIDPNPKSSNGGNGIEVVKYPEVIPALAPGQQWSTVWDFGKYRSDTDLPDYHSGKVTYVGISGTQLETELILDWSIYKSRQWVERRGIHDIAEAVRSMRDIQRRWTDGPQGSLSVYMRDGEAKDRRKADEAKRWQEHARQQREATADPNEVEAPQPSSAEQSE